MSAPLRRLGLSRAHRALILGQARAACPDEACGFLVGGPTGAALVVTALAPARNLWAGRRHDWFEIDPSDRIALQRRLRTDPPPIAGRAEGEGRRLPRPVILGVWHSHPTGAAWPSRHDAARAWEPGLVWLVVGLGEAEPKLAAFVATGQPGDPGTAFHPLALWP